MKVYLRGTRFHNVRRILTRLMGGAVIVAGICQTAGAQQDITRIEEDWEVRVIESDADLIAPQFTSVMSPDHSESSRYFSFEFNHTTSPEFERGGIQVQAWVDDSLRHATGRLSEVALESQDEKIRWTQFMEVDSQTGLVFGVSDFHSISWELEPRSARLVMSEFSGSNLNDYRIADSVENSAVGYSGNRIGYMFLHRVRVYSGNQLVETYVVNKNVNRGHATVLDD